jgi:DNA (cytosine-5)-methyltransferase 1
MRYLSVCSGIEAASVAWHHLGWTPVGFSEIEPFPAAVLKHRFPHVPNYGDMTKFEEWPIEPGTVDLLVGGTPCQSFSVAGLRKGLEDPRGNLMLTYLAIAARLRPQWIVWENVPGVLSSNGGRDFGTFLGALGELGYGWAYRVLDAQYVRVGGWPRAVPQRRRRVFVVGRLIERGARDWTAAAQAVLIPEGLRRHNQASPKTRKGAPSDAEGGARGGCWWDGGDCAGTLTKQNANGAQRMPDKDNFGAVLQPTAYRWQNDALGLQQDDAVAALRASAGSSGFHEMNHPVIAQPVPFRDVSPTLTSRMQGSSGWAPVNEDAHLVGQPVPYDLFQITAPVNRQNRKPGDPCHTLARDNAAHAAVAFHPLQDPISSTDGSTHCMGTGGSQGHASIAVAFQQNTRDELRYINGDGKIAGALAAEAGMKQQNYLAQAMTVRRLSARECERLQGFPDDYTLIPWRKKPAEDCPDGPRYKALGNSMACNCMAWIGEQIAKWEADHA